MKRYRKALTAACGIGATLLSAGLLDGVAEAVVSGLLGVATAAGVYQLPNAPAAPPVEV
jgi:hypothetical protein